MSKTTEVQIEKSRNLIDQGEEDERPDDNRQGLLRRIEEDPEGLLSAGTLARLRNSR